MGLRLYGHRHHLARPPSSRWVNLSLDDMLRLKGKLEIILGVSVANVRDQGVQQFWLIGQLTAFHIVANEVAEDAPEVLVPGIGQEASGVR